MPQRGHTNLHYTPRGIRTHTVRGLSALTLPIGVRGHIIHSLHHGRGET
jgi:hypothetical protein